MRDDEWNVGSVSCLLDRIKNGMDPDAAQQLFERYIRQLEWVARTKTGGLTRAASDEEDLAVTVLGQFFLGVRNGQFPQLLDRHDLWQILLAVLERRIIDQRRRKRETAEIGESAIGSLDSDGSCLAGGMCQVPSSAATPATIAALRDQMEHLVNQLPNEKWRRVVAWKLEQRTNVEISNLLDCSVRTVERILEEIRSRWQSLV